MAQAKKATRGVTKEITTEEPVIVLELSPAEAATLRCVGQKIGGNSDTSPRGHIADINQALYKAGVKVQSTHLCEPKKNSIYFLDNTKDSLNI